MTCEFTVSLLCFNSFPLKSLCHRKTPACLCSFQVMAWLIKGLCKHDKQLVSFVGQIATNHKCDPPPKGEITYRQYCKSYCGGS